MPYFPKQQESTYKCPGCEKWFMVAATAISCCLYHAPGTCCHRWEIEVSPPSITYNPVMPPGKLTTVITVGVPTSNTDGSTTNYYIAPGGWPTSKSWI